MHKNYYPLILSKIPGTASQWLYIVLGVSPLFVMSIQGWMNKVLFFAFGLSIYILVKDRNKTETAISDKTTRKWLFWLMLSFATPILAVFLGQLFRQDFSWPNYDSPTRLLVCIPILMVMVKHKLDLTRLLSLSIPCTIFITAISAAINPNVNWLAFRLSTYFINPITFGYLCIMLSLLSFVSIDFSKNRSKLLILIQLFGVAIGAYLSLLSLTRTGWVAVPIVLMLWLAFNQLKYKSMITTITILATILLSTAIYQSFPKMQVRIDEAVNETLNYKWSEKNPDTNVGARISMARLAIFLFKQKPLEGWGDKGFANQLNRPELGFASLTTREIALNNGFHNIISASAVKSGIWGLISIIAIFLTPALLYAKGLQSKSTPVRKLALLSMSFVIFEFISGMTIEIFDLKYTAAFYALMTTVFCGSLLVAMQPTTSKPL